MFARHLFLRRHLLVQICFADHAGLDISIHSSVNKQKPSVIQSPEPWENAVSPEDPLSLLRPESEGEGLQNMAFCPQVEESGPEVQSHRLPVYAGASRAMQDPPAITNVFCSAEREC